MSEPNWNLIAEAAYDSYALIARAEQEPLPVPEWQNLPPRLQEAWREAAKEACRLHPAMPSSAAPPEE